MSAAVIHAIHGFLGQSSDWNPLQALLPEYKFDCENLFAPEPLLLGSSPSDKKIFLGYSLGGRLGLDLLAQAAPYDHFVFLSTHPGLPDDHLTERIERLASDQKWADRIANENWESFLKDWNQQAVFAGSANEPERKLEDFDLQKLIDKMLLHSLAKQPDYRKLIQKNSNRITWVVGERDLKYCSLAESLEINFERVLSGHRIHLENPGAVAELIRKIR